MIGNASLPLRDSSALESLSRHSCDLTIIIVNWKSKQYLWHCLNSIYQNSGSLSLEIIVVDNASYDGSREMLEREFPTAIYLQSQENLGFSKANNLAFSKSSGKYILFLNPDTVIQSSALERMCALMQTQSGVGLVGAHLLNTDMSTQLTSVTALPGILNQTLNFDFLRRAFPGWKIWGMRALLRNSEEALQVEAISGACMLGKREVLDSVGAFSEDYFMYAEDMDLCLKVRQAGWTILYEPTAKIVHHGGGSSFLHPESSFSSVMTRRSLFHFFVKHRGLFYANVFRISAAVISVVRLLILVIASPLLASIKGPSRLLSVCKKWASVLVWSIGLA